MLFLFIVGLELDPSVLIQNAGASIAIASAGLIFPFLLSIPVAYTLYEWMRVGLFLIG